MYIVCDTEIEIDAIRLLTTSKYKYQITDGRWITVYAEGLGYESVEPSLMWFPSGSKEYTVLRKHITDKLHITYESIEKVYLEVKEEFTDENILMGITQYGMTGVVADALEKVDYYMRSMSVYEAFEAIDNIVRVDPFLSEERLTEFKTALYVKLVSKGVL